MRTIRIGRHVTETALTVEKIAERSAGKLDTWAEQHLFLDTFAQVRKFAPTMDLVKLEWACAGISRHGAAAEAAMIEALASLRAEGVQL